MNHMWCHTYIKKVVPYQFFYAELYVRLHFTLSPKPSLSFLILKIFELEAECVIVFHFVYNY